jgi:cytochrome b
MRIKVWDLPTRVFHWSLFVSVTFALLTGLEGGNWMVWHARAGLLILGLLIFRLVWGLLGSTYARFAEFAPTPGRLLAYLQGRWQGLGHNPLGALSVFALLALLLWQASSGLFSNDDIAFDGPLYDLVSKSTSDWLSSLHRQGLWLILGLVDATYLGSAVLHLRARKQPDPTHDHRLQRVRGCKCTPRPWWPLVGVVARPGDCRRGALGSRRRSSAATTAATSATGLVTRMEAEIREIRDHISRHPPFDGLPTISSTRWPARSRSLLQGRHQAGRTGSAGAGAVLHPQRRGGGVPTQRPALQPPRRGGYLRAVRPAA